MRLGWGKHFYKQENAALTDEGPHSTRAVCLPTKANNAHVHIALTNFHSSTIPRELLKHNINKLRKSLLELRNGRKKDELIRTVCLRGYRRNLNFPYDFLLSPNMLHNITVLHPCRYSLIIY